MEVHFQIQLLLAQLLLLFVKKVCNIQRFYCIKRLVLVVGSTCITVLVLSPRFFNCSSYYLIFLRNLHYLPHVPIHDFLALSLLVFPNILKKELNSDYLYLILLAHLYIMGNPTNSELSLRDTYSLFHNALHSTTMQSKCGNYLSPSSSNVSGFTLVNQALHGCFPYYTSKLAGGVSGKIPNEEKK